MKINPLGPMNNNPYRKQIERQEAISEVKQKRDKVEISKTAQEMQQVTKAEVARQEKVEALKEKVQSGEYKVDPHAVAKKFYEFWNE
ncbi:flagellar biosynthesis anti-sigma factor FlgM [Bacillus sp. FJAT-45350]|uniref:flagellar biosynthesis anti-sigma factor FlgM n=1 Tax=Bacillus sp. FJAT-45350 TaxID=2011014 RepID=UPI000BB88599|nr:flagellar biosynthesis anti-sigma factor FlgM [Bacillus sp. FJAT-45350]